MTPHKHAEAIRAWADGAQIEVSCGHGDIWSIVDHPSWALDNNYRVAVPPPKIDETIYFFISRHGYWQRELHAPNIAATFDGETHKLKSVEVLK
jgi:hypothetical protein